MAYGKFQPPKTDQPLVQAGCWFASKAKSALFGRTDFYFQRGRIKNTPATLIEKRWAHYPFITRAMVAPICAGDSTT